MGDESILEVRIEDLGDTTNNQEKIAQLEEEIEQLKHENKALKERNKHLNECLEENESKLEMASQTEQVLQKENAHFRFDNRQKVEDHQCLSEDLQKLQHSNDELKNELKKVHERMREMETASSRSECRSVGGHQPCCLRAEELEEEFDSANEQLIKYRTEAEEYKQQYKTTTVLFNQSRQRIKDLEEELETRWQTTDANSLFNEMALSDSIYPSPTRSPIQTPPTSPTVMRAVKLDESVQQISLSEELGDVGDPDVPEIPQLVSAPFVLPPEYHLLSRATFSHRSKYLCCFIL